MGIFILFLLIAVAAVALQVGFWVLVVLGVVRAVNAHQKAVEQSLRSFGALLGQAERARGAEGAVPLALQNQLMQHFLKAQGNLQLMDQIGQQRYETRVSGMLGDAAAAGIDVSSWGSSW